MREIERYRKREEKEITKVIRKREKMKRKIDLDEDEIRGKIKVKDRRDIQKKD